MVMFLREKFVEYLDTFLSLMLLLLTVALLQMAPV